MEREQRYTVIKNTDAAVLTDKENRALYSICTKIILHRRSRGARPLQCVVVESDWPEYEPTWAAIAARVDASTN